MNPGTLIYTGTLTIVTCWCGIAHAIPADLFARAERDHKCHVYCPLGHSWVVMGESEADKFKRLYGAAEDRAATARAERDQAEASRRAWKGQATKLRNRAAAGECPFCGEHVYQLSRHVTRKHADEVARTDDAEPTADSTVPA